MRCPLHIPYGSPVCHWDGGVILMNAFLFQDYYNIHRSSCRLFDYGHTSRTTGRVLLLWTLYGSTVSSSQPEAHSLHQVHNQMRARILFSSTEHFYILYRIYLFPQGTSHQHYLSQVHLHQPSPAAKSGRTNVFSTF